MHRSKLNAAQVIVALLLGVSTLDAQQSRDSARVRLVEFSTEHHGSLRPIVVGRGQPVSVLHPAISEASATRSGASASTSGGSETTPLNITSALSLRSGAFVLGNSASAQLLFFSADGTPGPVRSANGSAAERFAHHTLTLANCGNDSIVVSDERLYYFHVFAASGELVHERTLPITFSRNLRPYQPRGFAAYGDCTVLLAGKPDPQERASSDVQDTVVFSRVGVTDSSMSRVGYLRDIRPARHAAPSVTPRSDGPTVMVNFGSPAPVTPRASRADFLVIDSSIIHIFDDRSGELRSFDSSGELRRVVRIAALSESSAGTRAAPPERGDTASIQVSMLRDNAGQIWIEEYRSSADSIAHWTVVGRDGESLQRVQIPVTHRLWAVDVNRLLLSRADGDAVRFEIHSMVVQIGDARR